VQRKSAIYDRLQSKVAASYVSFQRAITFNKHCQEMLGQTAAGGPDDQDHHQDQDSLQQYQEDLEESLE